MLNPLNKSKFITKNWNIDNDQSNVKLGVGNEIRYITEILKSNLFNFNDAYALVRSDITIIGSNSATQVAFKNCAPFAKCITKTDGTLMNDAEDLDLVMLMYNLLGDSSNYSDTTGSLWIYSKE